MRKTYVGLMLLAWAAIGPVANAGQIVLGADALQMNTFVSYTPPGPTGGSCGPASLSDVDALTASLRAGPQQLQSQLSFAGAVCHTMSASAAITSSEIQFALNGGTGCLLYTSPSPRD